MELRESDIKLIAKTYKELEVQCLADQSLCLQLTLDMDTMGMPTEHRHQILHLYLHTFNQIAYEQLRLPRTLHLNLVNLKNIHFRLLLLAHLHKHVKT